MMLFIGHVPRDALRNSTDMHRKRWKRSCTLCSAVAYCCGAVAPRAIAALLGRFLPRLGPLVHSSGPFFFSGAAHLPGSIKSRGRLNPLQRDVGAYCLRALSQDTGV